MTSAANKILGSPFPSPRWPQQQREDSTDLPLYLKEFTNWWGHSLTPRRPHLLIESSTILLPHSEDLSIQEVPWLSFPCTWETLPADKIVSCPCPTLERLQQPMDCQQILPPHAATWWASGSLSNHFSHIEDLNGPETVHWVSFLNRRLQWVKRMLREPSTQLEDLSKLECSESFFHIENTRWFCESTNEVSPHLDKPKRAHKTPSDTVGQLGQKL